MQGTKVAPLILRLAHAVLAAAIACCAGLGLTGAAAASAPNSANRLVMWSGCNELPSLTDEELDAWQSRGVGGFACTFRHLRGLGGTQDFTGDPGASLAGANYELQRRFRDSRVVERMASRGMKAYIGPYFVNHFNTSTPLVEWFDDAGWSGLVTPKLAQLAAAARQLGFAGLAFDAELYAQQGGVRTATWDWDYPGNTRGEHEVRAQARQRGRQVMRALVGAFPDLELIAYDVQLPKTWAEVVQREVNGIQDVNGPRLDVDFWDGLSAEHGYRAIRLLDATFYKTPHVGTWHSAFQYQFNSLYSYLSRRFSDWNYASSRFHVSPFAWIDSGPSTWEQARAPAYVSEQLQTFRKWGMGGEFGNYAYGGLRRFDYTPYESAMRGATQPAVVDAEAPALQVEDTGSGSSSTLQSLPLAGTVRDNLAIRAVRWSNDRGGSGTAALTWQVRSGDHRSGYAWETRWQVAGVPLEPGANRITVDAEDIKGVRSAHAFTFTNGRPELSPTPKPRAPAPQPRPAPRAPNGSATAWHWWQVVMRRQAASSTPSSKRKRGKRPRKCGRKGRALRRKGATRRAKVAPGKAGKRRCKQRRKRRR